MFGPIIQSIANEPILSAILGVSETFQCTPLEFLDALSRILFLGGLTVGILSYIVIDSLVRYASRFVPWLFNLLKVHFQKKKES